MRITSYLVSSLYGLQIYSNQPSSLMMILPVSNKFSAVTMIEFVVADRLVVLSIPSSLDHYY
jgi:hypothetical protein